MRCAPRAANGPNYLGLCALQGAEVPLREWAAGDLKPLPARWRVKARPNSAGRWRLSWNQDCVHTEKVRPRQTSARCCVDSPRPAEPRSLPSHTDTTHTATQHTHSTHTSTHTHNTYNTTHTHTPHTAVGTALSRRVRRAGARHTASTMALITSDCDAMRSPGGKWP